MGQKKNQSLSQPEAAFEAGREAEFLKLLLDNLDTSISILDADMRYRLISAATYSDLNIDPADMPLGSRLSDCHRLMKDNGLLTEDMIATEHLSEEEQKDRPGDRPEESSLITLGNGQTYRHSRKALRDGHVLSIASNVSELVETDQLFDNALRLGNAGYWSYDFATKRYHISRSFKDYLGPETVERVYKKGIMTVVHPEDRKDLKSALAELKNGAEKKSMTCRSVTRHGDHRWSHVTCELVRDPQGRPLRIRSFVRDITEMRQKEAELERAKDEAIAASQAKSEFLANMSHEIRTPMNGVLGMAELLADSAINDQQREYVNVINSSASALLNIINDILDYSKIEAGALEIDPIPFDLRDGIDDVASLLSTSAGNKGLELIIDYPENLPRHFIGDAGRMRQILTNLVGNAIKFTESGYVRISVNAHRKGNVAVIGLSVQDTGIGIAPHKLDRVFEQFTQADGSTTRVYGGTGLGLTITKRLVEMMGGRMKVSSTLGKGSTFTALIPLPIDHKAVIIPVNTGALAGKRALIVDDIDVNCTVLCRQLENWGVDAVCVRNGIEAIEALKDSQRQNQPFDFALFDYLMPGLNGRELAELITHRNDLNLPPTLMLSSCDKPVSSAELAREGIDGHLVKPVRERRLYETIVRLLSQVGQTDGSRSIGAAVPDASEDVVSDEIVDVSAQIHDAPAPVTPAIDRVSNPVSDTPRQPILVAEDFHLNRDVVRLMLQSTDYDPVFAENGRQAVDMFLADPERFPVILMDVSMPVMDGFMATRDIRQWETAQGRKPVPIIALTGHAGQSDRQECQTSGMNAFLTKPIKQRDLLHALDGFCKPEGALRIA
jgi:PAS domain S-box-containing protein